MPSTSLTKKEITQAEFQRIFGTERLIAPSFTAEFTNGTLTQWSNRGCHGPLGSNGWDKSKVGRVYSYLWHRDPKKHNQATRYWEYILDPIASPWTQALQGSEVLTLDDKIVAFKIEVDNYTQSQLLMNLMIASRLPYEFPERLDAFNFFLDNGLNHVQSLYLPNVVKLLGKELVSTETHPHYCFDPDTSLKKVKDKTPRLENKFFRRGDLYYPCTAIWADKTYNPFSHVAKVLGEQDKYRGIFPDIFKKYSNDLKFLGAVKTSAEKGLKFIRETQEVWDAR